MNNTSLVFAGLLAGADCAVPDAAAQTIARTTPVVPINDGAGGFNAHFGDGFTAAESGRAFTELFTFDVTGLPFDAAASVTSSFLNSPLGKDLDILALSLYRYDPATLAVIGPAIAGIDGTGFGDGAPDSWSLAAYDLPTGAYAVRVDGQVLAAAAAASAPTWRCRRCRKRRPLRCCWPALPARRWCGAGRAARHRKTALRNGSGGRSGVDCARSGRASVEAEALVAVGGAAAFP